MKDPVNENRPARLALYGGAFDPVHSAHLRVARYALEQAHLDRVILIPAAQSPLKAHAALSSDAARLQMLRLAIEGEAAFEVDAYEIELGGVSYTINTVRHFRERFDQAELFWIIGGDQFEQLHHWRNIDELAKLVTFLVLERPGADLRRSESVAGLRYQVVEAPMMGESSSEIRARCGAGLPLDGLVPSAVQAFISEQELYTNLQ
ncbi:MULTISPECIES: nicotinate-nucleotide adenylyltransferase [unclassified Lentimonas]|uniref:nicotinate-nucleotide adenylyltransferase n=1 Tax=unclassified Lentimonas TaxID=2630993 RepID=UPI001324FA8B|nr:MULTISPECIES: nicotinate-nucleotide adenylyltransferase [unclassified Lentimonas]CAA6678516.1 Nicotinate-nucleotide adenylyltransferase (EC [Lentimonas sp. CC4]CAA6685748.1 Nicotinate-nucleotide adenylyltransferase (EC [Lentimonas sp. CC6]CAA7076222.1 Nicotinate-nucleotide adenylyltransferase (EC [Lentimonas sp. CC4]CAA7168726.1 Nicotinate-nucleotide adenylyltransferase (EC [Lentimonas sp. CC21]CAA7183464.1 Nicotinate-nucleotide adenylyltransferase (EC [Lentimonas sp. CC8]